MKRNVIALMAALVMAVSVFTWGCGGSSGDGKDSGGTELLNVSYDPTR